MIKPFRKKIETTNEAQFYHRWMEGSESFEVGYVIGACQLFRREVIETTGFLDENIFYGPEDADFCVRISRAGWKIMFLPQVSIIHHYLRMTTKRIFSYMTFLHLWAVLYFSFKQRKL